MLVFVAARPARQGAESRTRLARLAVLVMACLSVFALGSSPGFAQDSADLEVPHPTAGLLDPDALTLFAGTYVADVDNSVVENLEIHGDLRIRAENVTVRNVWVYGTGPWTVFVEEGSATFEYVEIGHPDFPGERGIGGDNVTARYLDIHHVEDGIKLDSNSLYEYVYVHDLDTLAAGPHADAVQADGGAKNSVIRNSFLDSTGPLGTGSASIILKSDLGPIDNIRIEDTYLNGGAWTFYSREGGNGNPTNVVLDNVQFGPDQEFGLMSIDGFVYADGPVRDAAGNEIVDAQLIRPGDPDPEPSDEPEPAPSESGPPPSIPTFDTIVVDPPEAQGQPVASAEPELDSPVALGLAFVLGALLAGVSILLVQRVRRPSTDDGTADSIAEIILIPGKPGSSRSMGTPVADSGDHLRDLGVAEES